MEAAHKTERALIWKRIVEAQLNRRQYSEKENAKLRETLRCSLHQAKTLRRAAKRKLRGDAVVASMDFAKRYQRASWNVGHTLKNNKVIFDELAADLDEVYDGVDT